MCYKTWHVYDYKSIFKVIDIHFDDTLLIHVLSLTMIRLVVKKKEMSKQILDQYDQVSNILGYDTSFPLLYLSALWINTCHRNIF
jgi:hypothetical protein